ncbi:hypothetical protein BpHYR1_029992 [Brachionus plicatilis]|uniref:Uncharacterized protein n=1 Tax=Brachionus plicatilis TaxID=10195 RepID=A0A3M7QTV6_BRAPC|nr:hypothetical protein BpHYR1_029992 [Brachionus plicatilis]
MASDILKKNESQTHFNPTKKIIITIGLNTAIRAKPTKKENKKFLTFSIFLSLRVRLDSSSRFLRICSRLSELSRFASSRLIT